MIQRLGIRIDCAPTRLFGGFFSLQFASAQLADQFFPQLAEYVLGAYTHLLRARGFLSCLRQRGRSATAPDTADGIMDASELASVVLRGVGAAAFCVLSALGCAGAFAAKGAGAPIALAERARLQFSRDELLVSTGPMSQAYRKHLHGEPVEARPRAGLELRLQRVFTQILREAIRLRPAAEHWGWRLMLVRDEALAPFAMPDGQIFVSPKWVGRRRLTDAEIALLLGHEMAHVIADHMLERISTFAAARPAAKLRVADVLQAVEMEWYLARELEPLMQAQELEADLIGLAMVCSAGISRSQALMLFDKMARADRKREAGYIDSHPDLLVRKLSLLQSMQARGLGCLD